MKKTDFNPSLGVAKCENFSSIYPMMNYFIFTEKPYEESRDGNVKEVLDFKTQITNPYRRCVGGYERNINIFFLLAEAIWIAVGRKDVDFLTLFNKKMIDFSDDGRTFHAPYGYRLRHWGIRTEDSFVNDNLNASKGYDQVIDSIKMLSDNPNTRQVVMSIWNPSFDLGYKSKDIPCNDIVMLKVRDGKLITTVQNRSNDLHWGLPTNIFQFSFLTELMASSLGIELGTQTHNSQSLHIYEWNEIAKKMSSLVNETNQGTLYDYFGASEIQMDFNFEHDVPTNRFREIEYYLNIIINNLISMSNFGTDNESEINQLRKFSIYLHSIYQILKIYLGYKIDLCMHKNFIEDENTIDKSNDFYKLKAIYEIEKIEVTTFKVLNKNRDFKWDISMLAKNFFYSRIAKKNRKENLGNL